jgi:hypothetical protein
LDDISGSLQPTVTWQVTVGQVVKKYIIASILRRRYIVIHKLSFSLSASLIVIEDEIHCLAYFKITKYQI